MSSVSQLRRSEAASEPVSSKDSAGGDSFGTAREREVAKAALGKRIEAARKARGLNRNQLAREVGSSWALVNRWEKGRTRPSVDSFLRLSQVLNVGDPVSLWVRRAGFRKRTFSRARDGSHGQDR